MWTKILFGNCKKVMLDGDRVRKWGRASFYFLFHQLFLAIGKGVAVTTKHEFNTPFFF